MPKVKKVVLHTNSNSGIPQVGICKMAIINKGTELQCNFFVMTGSGTSLLGMPDCERIQELSMKGSTMIADPNGRQVSEENR